MRRVSLPVLALALLASWAPAGAQGYGDGEIAHVANVDLGRGTYLDVGTFEVRVLDEGGDPVCELDGSGECLVDEDGDVVWRMELRDYVFLGTSDTVHVVDVSDPRAPEVAAGLPCDMTQDLSDPHVRGDLLLIGGSGTCDLPGGGTLTFRGFLTADVSDPRFPVVIGGTSRGIGTYTHRIAVHPTEPLVYVALRSATEAHVTPIYDISDPAAPELVLDSIGLPVHDFSIDAAGRRLHVAGGVHTAVVSLDAPRAPVTLSTIADGNLSYYAEATPDGAYTLAGDAALGGMHVYDLRGVEALRKVGVFYAPTDGSGAGYGVPNVFDFTRDGTVVVTGWGDQGLVVHDIAAPAGFGDAYGGAASTGARVVASMRLEDARAWGAELWEERHPGYVFVADLNRGLDIFHVPAIGPGFVSFGHIRAGTPDPSVTRTELETACDTAIASQGLDGWVSRLPSGLPGLRVVTEAPPASLATRFYDAGCGPLGGFSGAGPAPVPAGAAYALTTASEGSEVHLELRSAQGGWGAGCGGTSVGFMPLSDMAPGETHEGHEGGLYPGGSGEPPPSYLEAGVEAASRIVPRDEGGSPDEDGAIGLVSVGMSNTNQEFGAFMEVAAGDPGKDPRVVLVNGAQGGVDARKMRNPSNGYWAKLDQKVQAAGITSAQVQAVWLKQAIAGPSQPFPAHAEELRDALADIAGILAERFPGLEAMYASSRIYAGYATTGLNPEPYAYEGGFSVKWLVEDRIEQAPDERPWIGWGPYLWADGLTPRSDGLVWECADFASDGTHPATSGRQKVAGLLADHFSSHPTTGWYRS